MDDAPTLLPAPDRRAAARAAREAWATERRRIEGSRCWVSPAGPYPRWRARILHAVAMKASGWGIGLTGLYQRGRRNALAPELVEVELRFPTLPAAFDGYRILHLTDTHLDNLPELAPIAARLLDGLDIDLLAVTGDIVTRRNSPPEQAVALLAQVLSGVAVRDRRLAVLGNHDSAATAEALEAAGFEVLLNQTVALERGGERIVVTGLDDVHAFYTDAARRALDDDAGDFRVALVHSAEMADHAGTAGIALYLCGHTHGGQICLPGGRPLLTMLKRCRHAARGLWREGATIGYTSRGLGISGHPLRFNCPSEMTLFTLRRA
jgi:predicted MPP superfamily phosphohydrolase